MSFLKKIKNQIGDSKITQSITSLFSGDISVFCYHKITTKKKINLINTPDADLAINIRVFEKQIKYLSKNYKVLGVKDLIDVERLNLTKGKKVVITFDDGYLDNFYNALPILKKYNTKATIFITTGFVDNIEQPWWEILWEIIKSKNQIIFDENCYYTISNLDNKKKIFNIIKNKFFDLKKKQQVKLIDKIKIENNIKLNFEKKKIFLEKKHIIKFSKEKLIDIGAHTHNHENLGILNYLETKNEIIKSKNILENIIDNKINCFAYPYGSKNTYKKIDEKILKNNDIKLAFTTEFNNYKPEIHSQYCIPRMGLGNSNDNKSIRDKIYGLDSLIKRFF